MANARPPGTSASGTPNARIGIDLTAMRAAVGVARESGRQAAREISQAFRTVQNEQRLAIEQARQATIAIRGQQTQISATARAESQVRIQQARAESVAMQQAARTASQIAIQEERRKTAAFNAEIRQRHRAQGSMGGVGQFAGAALGGLGGPLGAVAGGIAGGTPAIAAGLAASQAARFIGEQAQIAVAYDRQRVAAVNLAGSQQRLNALLATYDRAAGGAVARTEALAATTKLMSVGFADNAAELEQFTRAIRGISVAMGQSQDTVTQNLILELFSQRGMRLDQLGLQYDKVRQRADELRVADSSLTQQQAYQNAVLEQAEQRYGKLADSAEGQRVGAEKLTAAWSNFGLTLGQIAKGPVDFFASQLATSINISTENMLNFLRVINQVNIALGITARMSLSPLKDPSGHSVLGRKSPAASPTFDADQISALRRREEGFADINREAGRARAQENSAYTRQLENINANYRKSTLREAQDFARQRLNAERKLNLSILDVAQESARQRVQWEEDTARAITEARTKTAERIADIDEQYHKAQERRASEHRDRLADAAGRLDAKAVADEQRNFARANADAKDARNEQIEDAREALQEQIADQRAALQRRIEEQKQNDARRIADMQAAFEEQKAQEDIERAIRLERQAEDHNAQLGELARQHSDRLQQIRDQAVEERAQFTEESNRFLNDVGIFNDKWLAEQDRINAGVLQRHLALLNAQRQALLNPSSMSPADPPANYRGPGDYAPPVGPSSLGGSTINRGGNQYSITIPIQAAPGQSAYDIAAEVDRRLFWHLEQLGGQ